MIQAARGADSLLTKSSSEDEAIAPSPESLRTDSGSTSKTTTSCPARIRRRVRFAPIRPSPTMPSCIRRCSSQVIPRVAARPPCRVRPRPATWPLVRMLVRGSRSEAIAQGRTPGDGRGRYDSPEMGDRDGDAGRMAIDRVRIVDKPWGHEEIFALVDGKFCGKVLHVNAGEALSLQYHERKEEVIAVQSGRCRLQAGEHESAMTAHEMGPGDSIHLPAGARHRVEAITDVV